MQKTINEKLAGAKLLRIDKTFEPKKGVLPYEVEAQKDGKPFNFSVGPKGDFLGTMIDATCFAKLNHTARTTERDGAAYAKDQS